jgi:tetratricopeptide (TPR) repeat protein
LERIPLKINPQYANAWYKGNALKNLGRNDEANKTFDEALKLQKATGFEIIFAIAGLIMITHLMRRK